MIVAVNEKSKEQVFNAQELIEKFREALDDLKEAYIDPHLKMVSTRERDYEAGTKVTICDSGSEYYVGFEVPGVEKEKLKVEATNFTLSVEGEVDYEWENLAETTNVILNERDQKKIHRKVTFSDEVKPEEIKALLKNGVLSVTIPKKVPKIIGEAIPVKVESTSLGETPS